MLPRLQSEAMDEGALHDDAATGATEDEAMEGVDEEILLEATPEEEPPMPFLDDETPLWWWRTPVEVGSMASELE